MAMFDSVWHLKELSMSRKSTAILKRVRCLSDHQFVAIAIDASAGIHGSV